MVKTKKKKKKSKWIDPKTKKKYMIGVGPWENIHWMTQQEYWQRVRHPEWFDEETKSSEQTQEEKTAQKLQRVIDAIVEFFEELKDENNIVKCPPVSASEGFYEGLSDALLFSGVKPKSVSLPVINAAWKEFRLRYPPFPRTRGINPKYYYKEPEPEKEEEPKPEKKKKRTATIFGFNVSSVIRRMANEGWEFEDAKKMLAHFEIDDYKDSTITGQLWCGLQSNKQKYGELADLTEDEVNKLFEVIR